jgi:hypothetical protein
MARWRADDRLARDRGARHERHGQAVWTVALLAALPDEFVARKGSYWRLAYGYTQSRPTTRSTSIRSGRHSRRRCRRPGNPLFYRYQRFEEEFRRHRASAPLLLWARSDSPIGSPAGEAVGEPAAGPR